MKPNNKMVILIGKKFLSGKNLVTSEKLVTFLGLSFQIKRTFMSGTAFFLEKVVLLVWDFSN